MPFHLKQSTLSELISYRKKDISFMLQPLWTDTFLKVSGDEKRSYLALLDRNTEYLAFLTSSLRNGRGKIRQLVLNDDLLSPLSSLYIDFNSLPGEHSFKELIESFREREEDELVLRGIRRRDAVEAVNYASQNNLGVVFDDRLPVYSLNLSGSSIEEAISRKTRSNIKRAKRDLEGYTVFTPVERDEKLKTFDTLVSLHQEDWKEKGEQGAFHHPKLIDFHKELIRQDDSNQVKFRCLCHKGEILSIIYSISHKECEYSFQGGFKKIPGVSLGLLTHFEAASAAKKEGMKEYNLMAGENLLKKMLAERKEDLYWLRIYKKTPSLFLENLLRKLKRMVKSNFK